MKITILDDYFDTIRHLPCFQMLNGHEVTIWNDHTQNEDSLVERLHQTEVLVLIRERTVITESLLARLPGLRMISQRSVFPHIDIDACSRMGIIVSSDQHPGTACYAAAELTWGLLLSAARAIPRQMASLRAGQWQTGVGTTLRGKLLGIYGYGRISRVVAAYAKAFGMKVVVYARSAGSRASAMNDYHVVTENRHWFFDNCDVITIHVRLGPETKHSITFDDLSRMRSSAILVNTSRAALVEPGALLRALDAGRPGMAAVDVYEQEPMTDANNPLMQRPNVICTPHIGYVTAEEFDLQFSDVFQQILSFADGKPINVVNPAVLSNRVIS